MNSRDVALGTFDELEDATRRLAPRNIRESTMSITGTLIGLIPTEDSFGIRLSADEVVSGRLGKELREADRLSYIYSYRVVTATVRQVRVNEGEPRYTLLGILE